MKMTDELCIQAYIDPILRDMEYSSYSFGRVVMYVRNQTDEMIQFLLKRASKTRRKNAKMKIEKALKILEMAELKEDLLPDQTRGGGVSWFKNEMEEGRLEDAVRDFGVDGICDLMEALFCSCGYDEEIIFEEYKDLLTVIRNVLKERVLSEKDSLKLERYITDLMERIEEETWDEDWDEEDEEYDWFFGGPDDGESSFADWEEDERF